MSDTGRWYGLRRYFGLHFDLHAMKSDTDLGTHCDRKTLIPMLKLMNPDFVQTDCKGHGGYTSWFSKVEHASVPPKLKKDALKQWREATRDLGLPLHCHYSGIWDRAAGAKHRSWCVQNSKGKSAGASFGEKMCPLGPYLEKLMIPQLFELIDRYKVDGFWIDGDLWAVEPCYCHRCCRAFTKSTGIKKPPMKSDDPTWPVWWNFTRENFESYVTRYCDAVHCHKPEIMICSNWLQTFNNPGEPKVPTDWISGDNKFVWGIDQSRCEARFLSTRNKPWDIMLWNFYCSHGFGREDSAWNVKPSEMLMQEAAVILSFGGNVQIYENPGGVRDGRLIDWRQKRLGQVGRFVKKRRRFCQGSETIPQIAVLHSEHHVRRTVRGPNLMHSVDVAPVKGAVYALLENHYGVDVLDEWALFPRLREFPSIIVPERHALSDEMVGALKVYVHEGGRLIVTGAQAFDRFGSTFLGATKGRLKENSKYHIPAADGSVPLYSSSWRLVKTRTAIGHGQLGMKPMLDDKLLSYPAATINKVGKGRVAYVPADLFRDFERNRYPLTRSFVGEPVAEVVGKLPIKVKAPTCIDVALRRKGEQTMSHLVNRLSGIPNQPENGAIDEIPPAGPVQITVAGVKRPKSVSAPLEGADFEWTYAKGKLAVTVANVRIHEVVVI